MGANNSSVAEKAKAIYIYILQMNHMWRSEMNIYEEINPCKNKRAHDTFQERLQDEKSQNSRSYRF